MRSTRRLLDRYAPIAVLIVTSLATGGAVASCSSDGDGLGLDPADAASETSTSGEAAAPASPADAETVDVTAPDVAPPPFDGGALPVVCTSDPCATSLVTTISL